ncbi:MAG: peptidoglycan/xylan/chitin deacetylase (PgdA/CDA1 family) [Limisphaerales bacterium]|jgi:peptidoglycan/xylan/chitin deacetylase (PgdA/CDA1 family)
MIKDLRKVVKMISKPFSVNTLIGWSGQSTAIPFYHTISDEPTPHISPIYPVRNTAQFEKDLDFFLAHFEPVSLSDLLESKPSKVKPRIHLTFDDGLRQVYDTALPLLLKKGIPATVFLNSAFIDNQGLMYRYKAALLQGKNPSNNYLGYNYDQEEILDTQALNSGLSFKKFLEEYKPYLTTSQIKSMAEQGITFGAHSATHPVFQNLTAEDQIQQVLIDKTALEQKLDLSINCFAFPFSDLAIPSTFFSSMHANGISYTFGGSGLKIDIPSNFPRFPMEKTIVDATHIVREEYAWFLFKRLFGKHKMKRN